MNKGPTGGAQNAVENAQSFLTNAQREALDAALASKERAAGALPYPLRYRIRLNSYE
jgi:hypothetical protein